MEVKKYNEKVRISGVRERLTTELLEDLNSMNRVDLETELALALIDELTPELDRMEIEHADTMDAMRERINELKDGVK